MRCAAPAPRPCRLVLLLAGCTVAWGAASGSNSDTGRPSHRPIARREGVLAPGHHPAIESLEVDAKAALRLKHEAPASLVALSASRTAVDSQGRSCPGGVTCGEKADNLIWDQACWDCLADYQEFYCEKNSLTAPSPTYVDVCAKEGKNRGAFCKKFAEAEPATYYEDCFFPQSEYKQLYCSKLKMHGTFNSVCAADVDVGPAFCEGFATQMKGYIQCHLWPGFMMLFCETKSNATNWDASCANHHEVGANFCEDFALSGNIQADCVKYASYLTLFCDIKASNNITVQTCATNDQTAGMYCQELALKKNGFEACWGVSQFDSTYCAEITWSHPSCIAMATPRSISR